MKKKILVLAALGMGLLSLAGCGLKKDKEETTEKTETVTEAQEAGGETTEAVTQEQAQEAADVPAIDPVTVYDANNIKITATGVYNCKEYSDEPVLGLEITNKTGKLLNINSLESSVNGWMFMLEPITITADGQINVGGYLEVPADNDTNKYGLYISSGMLSEYGITQATDLEFALQILVGEESEEEYFSERAVVKYPEAVEGTFDDAGTVAYDKDGVKLVIQNAEYDTDFWGPSLKVYAYNSGDKTVDIVISKAELNGKTYECFSDLVVSPGKHISESLLFDGASEEEPLGKATVTFEIHEFDPYGEGALIATSDPCTVEYDPAEYVESTEEAEAAADSDPAED